MPDIDCYKQIENQEDLSGFVISFGPLIKRIANHIKCKVPASVELDDLLQAGLIGLLEAKNSFSVQGGAAFETFASIKIRGAMIDEVRRHTGITRDISQNIKKMASAKSTLENHTDNSSHISTKAIAEEMGVSEKKYMKMSSEIQAFYAVSINEVDAIENIPCESSADPQTLVEKESIRQSVKDIVNSLPKREQQILALYYNEQISFRDIADIMNLTEARISQIHADTLTKVKRKYGYSYGELVPS